MLCSEAILVNQDSAEGHASVLRCKRWSCPLCTPFNHRLTKRRAREGRPSVFLTLTVNPERYETFDAAARDLKKAWVELRRKMQRTFGIDRPPFIAIFEATKKGWPHLHILMRCQFIPQRWFSDQMRHLIGAPIVDVRFIDNVGRVAAYVAKYVSKAPEAFAHCKRWWRSHDYAIDKEEPEPFARFGPHISEVAKSLSHWTAMLPYRGFRVVEERTDYVRWQWWSHPDQPREIGPPREALNTNFGKDLANA